MNDTRYDAYIVRIWQDVAAWRAQVTHVDSGRQRFFTSLGQLCLFWQAETAVSPQPNEHKQGDDSHVA
ncbi:MAG: hypothetical protein KC425_14765 [Anaerolineales bacterium]|nr:hypothetical protein [Anaerolineales bacterium]